MPRGMLPILLILWSCLTMGQDSSLTEEFGKLSAKERSRIAKLEQEEAVNDERYQLVMSEAEDLFRQQRFEEALERYQVARGMRPYNVYPKVKIQDLQVLISRRDAEAAEALPHIQPAAHPGPLSLPAEEVPVLDPTPVASEQRTTAPLLSGPLPRKETIAMPVEDRPGTAPAEPDVKLPDGITERTVREGRAIVLERVVVVDGRATIWRKVDHPWGETVHFKDGVVVPGRAWEEAFSDR